MEKQPMGFRVRGKKMQEISNMMQEETALSQAERAKAADISEKINLSDSGAVLQYGAALQKKLPNSPIPPWPMCAQRIWGKREI